MQIYLNWKTGINDFWGVICFLWKGKSCSSFFFPFSFHTVYNFVLLYLWDGFLLIVNCCCFIYIYYHQAATYKKQLFLITKENVHSLTKNKWFLLNFTICFHLFLVFLKSFFCFLYFPPIFSFYSSDVFLDDFLKNILGSLIVYFRIDFFFDLWRSYFYDKVKG